MSDNKPDKQLILDYVESLLYFYGVMDFESLYGWLPVLADLDRH